MGDYSEEQFRKKIQERNCESQGGGGSLGKKSTKRQREGSSRGSESKRGFSGKVGSQGIFKGGEEAVSQSFFKKGRREIMREKRRKKGRGKKQGKVTSLQVVITSFS